MTSFNRLMRPLVVVLVGLAALAAWARHTKHRAPPPAQLVVPRETLRVTVSDGTPLHVEVDGPEDGDTTVVLVHGVLARGAEWDAQFDALRRTVRVLRYDQRGHGGSGRVRGTTDIDLLGRDLGEVIDHAVPRGRVVIAGHSMGGMVILALAAQRPELIGVRVTGVTLVGSGAGHYVAGHPVENAVRWVARRHLLSPLLWISRLLAPGLEQLRPRGGRVINRAVRWLAFGRRDATSGLVRQTQRMLEEPPLRTMAALQGALLRHDKVDVLAALRGIPVTIIAGEDDRLTRVAHSYAMAEDLGPCADLRVLPGVGHAIVQSSAAAVTDAIVATFRRASDVARVG